MNKIKTALMGSLVILASFALSTAMVSATSYDWHFNLRNSSDTTDYIENLTPPTEDSLDRIVMMDGTTKIAKFVGLGTGLYSESGFLSMHDISPAQIPIVNTFMGQTTSHFTELEGVDADIYLKLLVLNSATTSLQAQINDIATSTIQSDWNVTSTTSQAYIKNKPTKSFAYPSRSLNSCFQISTTTDALVSYSVDISTSLSLTTGQQGTAYLEVSDDSGCSTGTQEIARFVNGNTGTLTVGLSLVQNTTGTLTGIVPQNKYVKIRTQNNTGTPTFTFRSAQEVKF